MLQKVHCKKKKKSVYFYLLIWIHQVFIVACWVFSFGMKLLHCGMFHMDPQIGVKPGSSALGVWTTREAQGCSLNRKLHSGIL